MKINNFKMGLVLVSMMIIVPASVMAKADETVMNGEPVAKVENAVAKEKSVAENDEMMGFFWREWLEEVMKKESVAEVDAWVIYWRNWLKNVDDAEVILLTFRNFPEDIYEDALQKFEVILRKELEDTNTLRGLNHIYVELLMMQTLYYYEVSSDFRKKFLDKASNLGERDKAIFQLEISHARSESQKKALSNLYELSKK